MRLSFPLTLGVLAMCEALAPQPPEARQLLFASLPSAAHPEETSAMCVVAEEYYLPDFTDYVIDYDTEYGSGSFKTVFKATLADGKPGAVGLQDIERSAKLLENMKTTRLRQILGHDEKIPDFPEINLNLGHEFKIQESLKECVHAAQVVSFGMPDTTAPETFYNFMPASVGGDLTADNWPPPREETTQKEALVQIAGAVKCMHDANIAHLDMKPQNINARNAERTDFELADYGFGCNMATGVGLPITKQFAPHLWEGDKYIGNPSSTITFAGGTAGFVAPEVMGGARCFNKDGRYDPFLADIWELGETFATLLNPDFYMSVTLGPQHCGNETEIDSRQEIIDTYVAQEMANRADLIALLNPMLQLNPAQRPRASDVMTLVQAIQVSPTTAQSAAVLKAAKRLVIGDEPDDDTKPGHARVNLAKSVDWAGYGPHEVIV
jgi:serine/threonine protein kinase